MSATFPHNSFLGGLNLFIRENRDALIQKGERPPYPIIVSNPTLGQAIGNLNKADLGIFLALFVLGFPAARWVIKGPFISEHLRRGTFNMAWTTSIAFGALLALNNSYYRLAGFVDNGLEWSRKEKKLKKYDFTRDYEENTIWKHLRIRE